jgi:hypothetical protein
MCTKYTRAALFVFAAAFVSGGPAWQAQAQPSAQQAAGQAQTQTRIQNRLRELSRMADNALANDDCATFSTMRNRIFTYMSGDPVEFFKQEAPGAAGMSLTALSDYQIGEIRKYAQNRYTYVNDRHTAYLARPAQLPAADGRQARELTCTWDVLLLSDLFQPRTWFYLPGTETCILVPQAPPQQIIIPRTPRAFYAPPDPETARRERIRSEARQAFAAPVPGVPCFEFGLSSGFQQYEFAHTRYLGISNGLTDSLGLLPVGDKMSGWYIEWRTNIHLGGANGAGSPLPGGFIQFGAFGGNANASSFFDIFDPGAGNRLLLPGPEGGASGVSAGGHPANIARDISYSASLAEHGLRLGVGSRLQFTPRVTLSPVVFGTFAHGEFNESLSLSIPGLGREARYSTAIDFNRFGIGIGITGETWLGRSQSGNFALRYAGEFSGFRVVADGVDTFQFPGLPTSRKNLDADANDWGAKFSAGIFLHTRWGGTLGIEGGYERRPGYPSIVRNGVGPSAIELQSADVWSLTGSFRFILDPRTGQLIRVPFDPDEDFY